MISALRALWACVDVVCESVCGCLEQAWGRFRGPACCGVAWPSSKALWLLNFYGESSAAQTFQSTRCTSQTHTHTSGSSPAFIRSATSSQACSLTLQRALSLSVPPLYSVLVLSFLGLVYFLCPFYGFLYNSPLYSTILSLLIFLLSVMRMFSSLGRTCGKTLMISSVWSFRGILHHNDFLCVLNTNLHVFTLKAL